MEEKAAETAAAAPVAAVAGAVAGDQDVAYCSEHPYPPGAAAAAGVALGGSGICAFCLQEKLGMLVSSSKSSPFHPPPSSVTPPSSEPPVPLQASATSGMPIPLHKAASAASGLRRSKSVAPRPEEPPLASNPSSINADSPRKKSFWSFLYSSSSSSHRSASSSLASGEQGAPSSARRKSVSVASAASASLGRRLEAIEEPADQSPSRRSEGSGSSSSFGRKVARSRSVGCGSRSFSGDFLERLSTGFGDCALRRVESHREPKPKGALGHHLGGAGAGDGDEDYDEYVRQHRIKCAGFFGGAAPPASSSYWLSAANGGSGSGSGGGSRVPGARSHRSWAWALASPMRALRPTSSASSKTIMSAHHNRAAGNNGTNGNMSTMAALSASGTMATS